MAAPCVSDVSHQVLAVTEVGNGDTSRGAQEALAPTPQSHGAQGCWNQEQPEAAVGRDTAPHVTGTTVGGTRGAQWCRLLQLP